MDVREKLVEIMADLGCNDEYCKDCKFCNDIDGCVNRRKEIIADRLIANGVTVQENVKMSDELLKQLKNAPITIYKSEPSIVTVQEWISVTERLPEVGGYVVCIAKRNPFSRFMPMVARREKNGWVNPMTEQYISEVTHWMKMPAPPEMEKTEE